MIHVSTALISFLKVDVWNTHVDIHACMCAWTLFLSNSMVLGFPVLWCGRRWQALYPTAVLLPASSRDLSADLTESSPSPVPHPLHSFCRVQCPGGWVEECQSAHAFLSVPAPKHMPMNPASVVSKRKTEHTQNGGVIANPGFFVHFFLSYRFHFFLTFIQLLGRKCHWTGNTSPFELLFHPLF